MTTRIKLRRDTAANWLLANPILAAGEPGLETDTNLSKYGDGVTHWGDLAYSTLRARDVVGNFVGYGPSIPNTSGFDAWFDAVVADPDGNAYYVGGQNFMTDQTVVVKVDSVGDVVWEKSLTWADGYEGWGTSAVYSTATDQLYVVAHEARNFQPGFDDDGAVIYKLNATNGSLASDPVVLRDDVTNDGSYTGWVTPVDIMLDSDGAPVVVGEKGGNATFYAVTTATGSTVDHLFVNSAQFLDQYPRAYNNWYITGTNIANEINITGVNQYTNRSTTALPSTGTGATFTISSDGSGGYVVDSVTNGGSGYAVGNKISILGTSLGGATPDNDAVVTVAAVDAGVISGVNTTPYGVSTGTAQFTSVSGTNITSGAGATFSSGWYMKGAQIYFYDYPAKFGVYLNQNGSGYAVGDKLTLPAESYGGTTTGTITITVTGNGGEINDWTFTGTFNTSTIDLTTNQSVDFGTTGTWQVNNWNSEGFVYTQTWGATFGGSEWDRANASAQDSTGNIYVAMETYDRTVQNGTTRGALVKISSTGTLVWSKNFDSVNWGSYNNGYTGVAVDSNDDIIVVQDEQITKVDSDGVVLWQKAYGQDYPMGSWNACVNVDSDDNIYWAAEYDWMGQQTNDAFLIFKLNPAGNVLWQREGGSATNNNTQWQDGYQILSVQGNRFYLAGNTYQGGDNIALAMNFPTDGTGASNEHTGRYFYNTTTWALSTTTATVSNMVIDFRPTDFTVYTTNTFVANTLTNVSETRSVRTGDVDGRIENLYSVSFEDGTVQKTAYVGGISQSGNSPLIYNTNNYYPQLEDSGKFIRWYADGWNDTVQIYVPNNDDVPFTIGTQIHFMKDKGIRALMFWNGTNANDNAVTILPATPNPGMESNAFNSGEGWSVHHFEQWNNGTNSPAMVTLTKLDTNRWLLTCSSANHTMDWSW